ncbi:MAG: helix-turn-helix transcriptional regulator [Reichenbachiella sp.]|uniref:helix-turn-helix domain-containing protein n=1 Tax=Reichenbachiella sp. TaxID=2184521 RepID=UPI003264CB01
MSNLNLFNTILLMGVIHGFLLTLILIRIKNRSVKSNRLLALFILLISLTMVGRLLSETKIISAFPNFLALPDAIIFLYGPLMFLYFRKLLVQESLKTKSVFLHFVPAIIFILSEIPLLFDDNHWMKILWREETRIRFILIEGLAIGHNVFYFILNRNMALAYVKISDNNFSFKQHPSYLKAIFILTALTLLIWLFSYLSWVTGNYNLLSVIGYRMVWLILAFTTYILGYFAMKNPDFYKMTTHSKKANVINKDERDTLLDNLDTLMSKDKPYLDPAFDLQVLSELLSINKNKASQLINSEFNKNFNDWTNDFRIDDAKELLSASEMSIKEIYYKVGFNSKSVFNDAFKKRVKTTPSDYKSGG